MDRRTTKRGRGRLRLLVLSGLLTLAGATAAIVIIWADEPVDAHENSVPSTRVADTTQDDSDDSSASAPYVYVDDPANAESQNPGASAGDSDTAADTPASAATDAATGSTAAQSPPQTSAQTAAHAAPDAQVKLAVYFASGEKLVPVIRQATGTTKVGSAALESLLRGPTGAEREAGLTSAIPAGTTLRGLPIKDGLATVDLSGDFASGVGTSSMYTRLGQLVYTITELPTVDRVKLRIHGRDIQTLGGEGLLIGSSLSRTAYTKLISGGGSTGSVGGTAPNTSTFKLYLVSQETLSAHTRTIAYTPAVGKAALENLFAGPSSADKARGANTAIPAGTKLLSLSIKDNVATVDLSKQFTSGGESQSMHLRLGQIVYTLTDFPTVDSMRIKVEGKTLSTLGGGGLLVKQPLSRTGWAKIIQ